ncbi:unnamed protein product [Cylicocyclus nassatus]|uniref:Uncharacterized protein n=1 Tax=Cylicocyclus nassatus TaxID=53992 RepID=A0AA36DSK6_CYLNA|nr:unnamed protein product [Cylicocyclus nassatus]
MTTYSIFVFSVLATVTSHNIKPFNVNEPLALTISPKVWNLLETKATVIEDAVKSIEVPEVGDRKWWYMFKAWNIKFTKFKVPRSGVSFENMRNGVYIKIKGAQLEARARAKFRLLFVTSGSGDVMGTTDRLNIDARLSWSDFSFTPKVDLDSNLRLKFHGPIKILNLIKKFLARLIDKKLKKLAVRAIEKEVNPHLQEFKRKMVAKGLTSYTVQLSVQRNSLHVSITPKSAANVITPLIPINNMVCLNANMLSLINAIQEREERSVHGDKIDVTCLSPELKCEISKLKCSLCSDIDIKYTSGNSDKFHNCLPKLPF